MEMSKEKQYVMLAFLSAGILSLPACMPKNRTIEGELTMKEVAALELPLDSITTQETSYMQLVDDSTLAFFNKPTYDICLYNLNSRFMESRINLKREGPNAVNGIDAFYVAGKDSLWLYASWGRIIYLLDGTGILREKKEITEDSEKSIGSHPHYSVSPFPTTTAPYIVTNGKHILQGMDGITLNGTLPGATLIYNWEANKATTGNPYPSIYGEADKIQDNWDTFGYRETYYTLNPRHEIVTSFPASDSLYVYSPDNGTTRGYYAGYSGKVNISPGVPSDPDKKVRKFISQHQYSGILYDKFNHLYYRIIRLPGNENTDNVRKELSKKPVGIIILDDNFNKVGEYMLPDDRYYTMNAFVSTNGLHVNTFSENDDIMTFRVFKPSPFKTSNRK